MSQINVNPPSNGGGDRAAAAGINLVTVLVVLVVLVVLAVLAWNFVIGPLLGSQLVINVNVTAPAPQQPAATPAPLAARPSAIGAWAFA